MKLTETIIALMAVNNVFSKMNEQSTVRAVTNDAQRIGKMLEMSAASLEEALSLSGQGIGELVAYLVQEGRLE